MRCWVGNEIEYNLNYGNRTVFVKGRSVDVAFLITILKKNNLINVSIYFGAGEEDLVEFVYTKEDLNYLKSNYKLIIETNRFYPGLDYQLFDNIIIRVSVKDVNLDLVSLKLRSEKEVIVCNAKDNMNYSTSLLTLKDDGTFSGVDTIIYED